MIDEVPSGASIFSMKRNDELRTGAAPVSSNKFLFMIHIRSVTS